MWKVLNEDSFWNKGKRFLGNGLLNDHVYSSFNINNNRNNNNNDNNDNNNDDNKDDKDDDENK